MFIQTVTIFRALSIIADQKANKVSETGCASFFKWQGEKKPTLAGPLKTASP
jgi:hypothetical protein